MAVFGVKLLKRERMFFGKKSDLVNWHIWPLINTGFFGQNFRQKIDEIWPNRNFLAC